MDEMDAAMSRSVANLVPTPRQAGTSWPLASSAHGRPAVAAAFARLRGSFAAVLSDARHARCPPFGGQERVCRPRIEGVTWPSVRGAFASEVHKLGGFHDLDSQDRHRRRGAGPRPRIRV